MPDFSSPDRCHTRRRVIHACAACGITIAIGCGGCASLTLATLGTVAGAAASAVSTGKDVYQLGKLDSAEMADFGQTVEASCQAAGEMGLTRVPDPDFKPDKDRSIVELLFVDDKRAKVLVRVERRAWRLVRVRIDVGFFGSEVTARLFLDRLRAHLPVPIKPSTRPSDDPRVEAAT